MKTTIYLSANRRGVVRMTKGTPHLARDEIGVQVNISIPDGAFRSPLLTASLEVAEDEVIQPSVEMTASSPVEFPSPTKTEGGEL